MEDNRRTNAVKGKVRRLLDQCDNHIHIIALSGTIPVSVAALYVTVGNRLVNITNKIANISLLTKDELKVESDYFPDAIITKVKVSLRDQLGLYDVKFETHAAAICPVTTSVLNEGEE